MKNEKLAQFANEKYLNLETFRKNGAPVQTPMWFAEEGGVLYVYSLANVGKVKRIRNNPLVRVTPCTVSGKVKGTWVEAKALILDDTEAERGHNLLAQKYGLSKRIGSLFSKIMNREHAVMAIHVD